MRYQCLATTTLHSASRKTHLGRGEGAAVDDLGAEGLAGSHALGVLVVGGPQTAAGAARTAVGGGGVEAQALDAVDRIGQGRILADLGGHGSGQAHGELFALAVVHLVSAPGASSKGRGAGCRGDRGELGRLVLELGRGEGTAAETATEAGASGLLDGFGDGVGNETHGCVL